MFQKIDAWFRKQPVWVLVILGMLFIPIVLFVVCSILADTGRRRGSPIYPSLSGAIDATGQISGINKATGVIVDQLDNTNKRVEKSSTDIATSVDKLSSLNESAKRDASDGLGAIDEAKQILESAPRRKRKPPATSGS